MNDELASWFALFKQKIRTALAPTTVPFFLLFCPAALALTVLPGIEDSSGF
jgi:hypothetical protein